MVHSKQCLGFPSVIGKAQEFHCGRVWGLIAPHGEEACENGCQEYRTDDQELFNETGLCSKRRALRIHSDGSLAGSLFWPRNIEHHYGKLEFAVRVVGVAKQIAPLGSPTVLKKVRSNDGLGQKLEFSPAVL